MKPTGKEMNNNIKNSYIFYMNKNNVTNLFIILIQIYINSYFLYYK